MLTGERVWETPWPEADLRAAGARRRRDRRAGQRQAARPRAGAGGRLARGARGDGARAPERAWRTSTASRSMKVVVVPAKLVNFVVR